MSDDKELHIIYREKTKKLLWKILWGFCIATILFEIPLHRHSHFADHGVKAMDGIFSFYGLVGLLGCLALILIAKALGIFLKTREDYYDGCD